jgi:hypothetical protein
LVRRDDAWVAQAERWLGAFAAPDHADRSCR